jgi:hypothetical protein
VKGSRVPALLVGLTAALTLAACGVPPSDVIQAGEPAGGIYSPSSQPVVPTLTSFYFLHNGDLRDYPRRFEDPRNPDSVVRMLFDGPIASEALTATTELPRLTDTPDVVIGSDNILSIELPKDVPPLSHLAMRQLACTMAHLTPPATSSIAEAHPGGASAAPKAGTRRSAAPRSVRVFGDGWTKTQSAGSCPGRP